MKKHFNKNSSSRFWIKNIEAKCKVIEKKRITSQNGIVVKVMYLKKHSGTLF